jgi:hypothetical protein
VKKLLYKWNGFTNTVWRWWIKRGRVYVLGAPAYGLLVVRKTAPESLVMLGGGLASVLGIVVLYDREPTALGVLLCGVAVFLLMFWRVRWLWRIAQQDS